MLPCGFVLRGEQSALPTGPQLQYPLESPVAAPPMLLTHVEKAGPQRGSSDTGAAHPTTVRLLPTTVAIPVLHVSPAATMTYGNAVEALPPPQMQHICCEWKSGLSNFSHHWDEYTSQPFPSASVRPLSVSVHGAPVGVAVGVAVDGVHEEYLKAGSLSFTHTPSPI